MMQSPKKNSMRGLISSLILLLFFSSTAVAEELGSSITSLLKLPVPTTLEFCGEPVPLARRDIAERLDLELIVALGDPVSATLWFKRKERFFPLIEARIKDRGLPLDLRYLPVIESNLRAEAVSSARAVGPWQFMSSTGRSYGLRRDSWRDDRRNWEKSTDAALRHLKDLYDDLGTWPLAMAAYNAGKRRVTGAMERQGQKDFYGLKLPRETERYVFRIMAAKLILENPEAFGINVEGARFYPPEQVSEMTIRVNRRRLPLSAVADAAGVSFKRLKELNPWIVSEVLPKGTYRVHVPTSAEGGFGAALDVWQKANPEPETVYHRVRKGDTLSAIAKKYGVRLNDLLAWNSLSTRTIIRPGQKIAVRRTN